MANTELEYRAIIFASNAHGSVNQVRKYSGQPYIVHPIAVANIVRGVNHTPEMLAAAYLHDVVEDTPVTIEEVYAQFGNKVGELVGWLTDISKPSDGNRKVRKAIDRQHTWEAPWDAQTIKLADLIDNTKSIVVSDPNFARVYMKEKAELIAGMTGHPKLRGECLSAVQSYFGVYA